MNYAWFFLCIRPQTDADHIKPRFRTSFANTYPAMESDFPKELTTSGRSHEISVGVRHCPWDGMSWHFVRGMAHAVLTRTRCERSYHLVIESNQLHPHACCTFA